jgi:hypothetical protein
VEIAKQHHLPMIYPYRDYVEAGGLAPNAPDLGELACRMAEDVHQILNGAKPGEISILPTHQVRTHHQPESRQGDQSYGATIDYH